jgi:hypothetical protein
MFRTQVNIIIQLTKFLDSLFLPFLNNEKKNQLQLTSDFIHAIFLQAFIWSVSACLKQEDRIQLDTFIKYLSGLPTASMGSKAKSGQLPNEKPLLLDHIFQSEFDQWIKWDDLIPKYEHDRSQRFSEIFVPTVDTVRLGMISSIGFPLRNVPNRILSVSLGPGTSYSHSSDHRV